MINRSNYGLAKEFLAYLRDVTQIDHTPLDRYWSYLKHLLLWADESPFSESTNKRPTFASYLTATRSDGNAPSFAPVTVKKIFQTAKRFFI